MKYIALTLLSILIYCISAHFFMMKRGYFAIGGEAMILLTPLIYRLISSSVKDAITDIKLIIKYSKEN